MCVCVYVYVLVCACEVGAHDFRIGHVWCEGTCVCDGGKCDKVTANTHTHIVSPYKVSVYIWRKAGP